MDSELFTQVLALLTAAWTAWQEFRHRKDRSVRPSVLLEAKPVKKAKP